MYRANVSCCCCYHKGTYFQANHNYEQKLLDAQYVVVATTKVRIFKQITTFMQSNLYVPLLLLLPQRYVFSSKSQLTRVVPPVPVGCCCYHKGTYFQANHNKTLRQYEDRKVVVATTKVRIFKQITTVSSGGIMKTLLLLLPQRYVFSSKSQQRVL